MNRVALRHGQEHLLICFNMQKEQQISRHGFDADEFAERLSICTDILNEWRARGRPIVHLKRLSHAAWFNPASSLTTWLDGWSPLPGEDVFEHDFPSAYSSQRFSEFIQNLNHTTCHLLGFSLEETVLATAVDSFHRGHNFRVIEKATFSIRSTHLDTVSYRNILIEILNNFVPVESDDVALRA